MTPLRLAVLYAALVGVPVAGVVAVLEAGGKIVPPSYIQGVWHLQVDLQANASTPCADRLSGFTVPQLTIDQSGVFIEVQLPTRRRERLAGRFEENHLLAEAAPRLFGGDVFDLLRLTAVLGEENGQAAIRGVLGMPRRIECNPMPFVATRQKERKP
jgi:hypothetical protein